MPWDFSLRNTAWKEIVDGGIRASNAGLAALLDDAWDTAKQSREYLNLSDMSKFDLDNVYYGHAYKQDA